MMLLINGFSMFTYFSSHMPSLEIQRASLFVALNDIPVLVFKIEPRLSMFVNTKCSRDIGTYLLKV